MHHNYSDASTNFANLGLISFLFLYVYSWFAEPILTLAATLLVALVIIAGGGILSLVFAAQAVRAWCKLRFRWSRT
mgnify:FL=1